MLRGMAAIADHHCHCALKRREKEKKMENQSTLETYLNPWTSATEGTKEKSRTISHRVNVNRQYSPIEERCIGLSPSAMDSTQCNVLLKPWRAGPPLLIDAIAA